MKKREKSAAAAEHISSKLRCPLCHEFVEVRALSSLVCINNHTFDFAKQGYVNLLQKPVNTQYDDALFDARHRIISKVELYAPIHDRIADIITNQSAENSLLFDAGSGEGSHLKMIQHKINTESLTGIGLDISKAGVMMAAKNYDGAVWFVGDLANPPLADKSCNFILNFLSPANYAEFKRILTEDGMIIKVIPGSGYLKELRNELFNNTGESEYENNDTLELMKRNVKVVSEERITYKKTLNASALKDLISMTPLGWHADDAQIETFISSGDKDITVDMHIVIAQEEKNS
ncbi:MAG TPA: SAM-dependent methyltransferase [Jeotgalicoccus sp.]|nr:SAM-dependent methyltransferase [Jeotgalicoccus sp.]